MRGDTDWVMTWGLRFGHTNVNQIMTSNADRVTTGVKHTVKSPWTNDWIVIRGQID